MFRVIDMYQIGDKTYFSSYTEAKLALLAGINAAMQLTLSNDLKVKLERWADNIKLAIDSHAGNLNFCDDYDTLTQQEKNDIKKCIPIELIQNINDSPYDVATPATLVDDNVIRTYEGTLPSLLLNQPTTAMLENAKQVSDKIILNVEAYMRCGFEHHKVCKEFGWDSKDDNAKNYEGVFKEFALNLLHHLPDRVYTGGFTLDEMNNHLQSKGLPIIPAKASKAEDISIEQAQAMLALGMATLKENRNFERVMYIQFTFAQTPMRNIPMFGTPLNEPTGVFGNEVRKRYGSMEEFIKLLRKPNTDGFNARKFFSDDLIYFSDYYRFEANKGRSGKLDSTKVTKHYGLLKDQTVISKIEKNCPNTLVAPQGHLEWTPDTVSQAARTQSAVVKSYVENEAAYISGPSGTFSLLASLQCLLVNPRNLEDQQIYLQSMLSYIVGTGLHSIHEVLGPAEMITKMIPGYNVEMPSVDQKSTPPNFNQFYEYACRNDPEFKSRLDASWDRINTICVFLHENKLNMQDAKELFENKLEKYNEKNHDNYIKMLNFLTSIDALKEFKFDPMLYAITNRHPKLVEYLEKTPPYDSPEYSQKRDLFNIVSNLTSKINKEYKDPNLIDDMSTSSYFRIEYNIETNSISVTPGIFYNEMKDETDKYNLKDYIGPIKSMLQELGIEEANISKLIADIKNNFKEVGFDLDESSVARILKHNNKQEPDMLSPDLEASKTTANHAVSHGHSLPTSDKVRISDTRAASITNLRTAVEARAKAEKNAESAELAQATEITKKKPTPQGG